jgi:hypothetical protein
MYFYSICTEAYQPKFGEAAEKHTRALNNYLVYGISTDATLGENMPKLPKQKVVRHQAMAQTLQASNGTIYTTTTLCCEDDE